MTSAVVEQHSRYSHSPPQFRRSSPPPPITTLSASSTPGSEASRPRSTSAPYSRVQSYHSHPYLPPPHHYYQSTHQIYPADVYPPPPPTHIPFIGGHPPSRDSYREPYGSYASHTYSIQGHSSQLVYTEDAATKLSDRVRRRCFNCCTTDTSTWRRSNLSPGKVLCNKCGLFERTHSRPRPEQFPHKRGPLAASTLRSRSSSEVSPPSYPGPSYPPSESSSSPHIPGSSPRHLPAPHSSSPLPQNSLPPRPLHTSSPAMPVPGPQLPPISSNGHSYDKYEDGPNETRLPTIQSWAGEVKSSDGERRYQDDHDSPKLAPLKHEESQDSEQDRG